MIVARYQTIGDEVYEHDLGPTIGYDNIEEGFILVPDEEWLADLYADGDYRKLEVVCELPTLGL